MLCPPKYCKSGRAERNPLASINATDENISVRSRAIHSASYIQMSEAQFIAQLQTSPFLKLTLMVRFCGVLTQMQSAFLTEPFCINTSNNAKDENISVRSRAIHSTSYIQMSEAQFIAQLQTSPFLKLTLMVRFCGVLTQMQSAFLTEPFCINTSNNAKDENISVRSRAIHSTSYIQMSEAQFIAQLQTSPFLKLTLMVRFCGVLTQMQSAFLTEPFCINTSNNANTRISVFVVAQFIAPLTFKEKRRNELRDYERVLSLN